MTDADHDKPDKPAHNAPADAPTDETEQAEAEALAGALDGSTRAGQPPEEALQTAAMLRYSGDGGALSAERGDAILAELGEIPMPAPQSAGRNPGFGRWWLGIAAASAAAMLVVMTGQEPEAGEPAAVASAPSEEPPEPSATTPGAAPSTTPSIKGPAGPETSPWPAPPATLLSAQAAAATGKGDPAAFEAEMREYRAALLRKLQATYPSALTMLEPRRRRGR